MAFTDRLHNRGSISTGYDINNSLKLEDANNEWLYRASPTAGNRRTYTFSFWIKRTELGLVNGSGNQFMIGQGQHGRMYFGSEYFQYRFDDGHDCRNVSRQFRDTSAWYHFVVAVDTNQSSSSNRVKLYVNGESLAVDDHDGGSFPDLQDQGAYFSTSYVTIGTAPFGGSYNAGDGSYDMSGYLAEFCGIDGTQYAPTDFGEFDEDTGIWKPKDLSDITWGSEGYYLKFDDSSALGADSSGNGNDFTLNNIAAADQATDTPTNNFANWNVLDVTRTNTQGVDMVEGAMSIKHRSSNGWTGTMSNIAVSKGKWYWEAEVRVTNGSSMWGVIPVSTRQASVFWDSYIGSSSINGAAFYDNDDAYYHNATATNCTIGGSTFNTVTGDVIMIAVDMDNNKLFAGVNGNWCNSSDNTLPNATGITLLDEPHFLATATYAANTTNSYNFGGFTTDTISSPASDADGYGTFEYAPPSGYYALCTKNLEEYG